MNRYATYPPRVPKFFEDVLTGKVLGFDAFSGVHGQGREYVLTLRQNGSRFEPDYERTDKLTRGRRDPSPKHLHRDGTFGWALLRYEGRLQWRAGILTHGGEP